MLTTSVVLASCALISGASDLTIGDVGAPEAGAAEASLPDVLVADTATVEVDAEPRAPTCDEPGLVARWTFDEDDGGLVSDCTSFRHTGHVDGGVWTNGERDGGMSFDGGWVGFGSPPGLQLSGPLTVCAWIQQTTPPSADPAARSYVVGKLSKPNGGGWRLATGRGASATVILAAMNVPDGDGGFNEAKGGAMTPNVWNHVCGRYTSSATTVFANGILAGTDTTASAKITLTNDELRVGTRSDGTQPFVGVIDDVRIYSRALTDAEIAALARP